MRTGLPGAVTQVHRVNFVSFLARLHQEQHQLDAYAADPWREKVEAAVRDKDAISTAALLDLLRASATTGTARRLAGVMRSLNFVPIKSRRLMPGGRCGNTVTRGWARPVREMKTFSAIGRPGLKRYHDGRVERCSASLQFEFLDRGAIEMPADYLPDAPGVMFAGEEVFSAAGYVRGSNRPRGWHQHLPGDYRKPFGEHVLVVRQCGNARSQRWTVERVEPRADKGLEALVSSGEKVPIWARTYQAAMRLAEYCYPIPRPPVFATWKAARVRR